MLCQIYKSSHWHTLAMFSGTSRISGVQNHQNSSKLTPRSAKLPCCFTAALSQIDQCQGCLLCRVYPRPPESGLLLDSLVHQTRQGFFVVTSWNTILFLPWKWKMGSWKMCGLSPNGLFSTSMIMGGRVMKLKIPWFLRYQHQLDENRFDICQ